MQVLKVNTKTITSSFRLPNIHVGELPTYDMPPPSTLHGYINGALGRLLLKEELEQLEFAYIFKYESKSFDCETMHNTSIAKGKIDFNGKKIPKSIEIQTNIQHREFLFNCEMRLFLKSENLVLLNELKKAFISPEFACVLGRSQDLATCNSADFIELEEKETNIFMQHSLIPFYWRQYITVGEPVMMVSYIDSENREPNFKRYLQLFRKPLLIYQGSPNLIQKIPDKIYSDKNDIKTFDGVEFARGLYFMNLFDLNDSYAKT
ncbi:MAG: CRISPR-associated protein Cas5 [Candidatus Sericytochromatia bacterium]